MSLFLNFLLATMGILLGIAFSIGIILLIISLIYIIIEIIYVNM